MGEKLKIVKIIVASVAVLIFLFTVMPQFFFVAKASQVRPSMDYSPPACADTTTGTGENFEVTPPPNMDPEPSRPQDRTPAGSEPEINLDTNEEKGQAEPIIEPGGNGSSGNH